MKKKAASVLESYPFFGSNQILFEATSEFTTTLMALELAGLLEVPITAGKVEAWLLGFRNFDGGFGVQGNSDISATYYAVASLALLAEGFDSAATLRFVRACEKPHGGFTVIPINYMPYMEHTFCGAMALGLLGEKCRYPEETANWVLKCQNKNGGFARGELGISTMLNTYQATVLLQKLTENF